MTSISFMAHQPHECPRAARRAPIAARALLWRVDIVFEAVFSFPADSVVFGSGVCLLVLLLLSSAALVFSEAFDVADAGRHRQHDPSRNC